MAWWQYGKPRCHDCPAHPLLVMLGYGKFLKCPVCGRPYSERGREMARYEKILARNYVERWEKETGRSAGGDPLEPANALTPTDRQEIINRQFGTMFPP